MRFVAPLVLAGVIGAGVPLSAEQSPSPMEVVAAGFADPVGVAVDESGAIVVSDRIAGTIVRIAGGSQSVLLSGLHRPAGLAFDAAGGLLIAEQGNGRVLRRDPSGALTVFAGGINGPRWIAVAPDGMVYVSAKGLAGGSSGGGSSRLRRVLRVTPAGVVSVFVESFAGLQGLVVHDGAVVAAIKRLPGDTGSSRARLVRVPILADGSAGAPQVIARDGVNVPVGVAADPLGALMVTARSGEDDDDDRDGDDEDADDDDDADDGDADETAGSGVVLKRLAGGTLATLATGLREPRGLVMERAGHLLIVEGKADRLVRLRAPAAPVVTAPAFTNQVTLALTGSAEPGSLVQAFRDAVNASPLASTAADSATGAFALSVPLAVNSENVLLFTATGAGGIGLTSPATSRTVVHDDRPPVTTILEPPSSTHVNSALTITARGEDDGSGVASLAFAVDGQPRGETSNPDPAQPLVATFALDTMVLSEGPHTLEVTASDRATNSSAAAQLFIVDRTPPDTQVVSGPGAETAETTVTFTIAGTDAIASSDALTFAWRLDEGTWSLFGPQTPITVSGLAPGPHRFEVKARDLAANEDSTPAVQAFAVTSLRVVITEPADGAVVIGTSVWVRGTVDSAQQEVTVNVSMPAGSGIPPIAAGTEAGTFAVEVPVDATTTTLTATVTDVLTGATASHTITITTQLDPEASSGIFRGFPGGGLAPHVVTFSADVAEGDRVALDLEGDGSVDFEGPSLNGQPFVFLQPGIYVPSLRVTSSDGRISIPDLTSGRGSGHMRNGSRAVTRVQTVRIRSCRNCSRTRLASTPHS